MVTFLKNDLAVAAAVAVAVAAVAAEIPYLGAAAVGLNSFDIIHLSVVAVVLSDFVVVGYMKNIYHLLLRFVDFVLDPL